jgi:hypothetical protein
MKKITAISILVILLAACQNNPPTGKNGVVYKSAVTYNDYIISRQNKIVKKMLAFGKMAGTDPDSAYHMLDVFAGETAILITELEGMPPYKNDSLFRNAAISSFQFYKRTFEKDYKELLGVSKRENISADEAETEMNKITDRLTKEEELLDKNFHNAQVKFARDNKLQLTDNTLSKEIEKMGQ